MRTRRLAVLLTVVALTATACGGRGSDTSSVDSSTTTSAPADTGTDTTSGAPGPGPGDFGTLTDVCGPNEGGGQVPDATDGDTQGVSADTIVLGTVSDPGFTGRLGLNQEIFDAATAFVQWCNDAGGINGKKLEVNLHDAAITQYQPVVEDACRTDFALVGAGAVQDNLWPDVGAACGLIDIAGFSVTPQKAGVAGQDLIALRSVQAIPNPGDRYQAGGIKLLDAEFPDTLAHTGFLYGDLQTLKQTYDKFKAGYEALGHTIVEASAYNILGEANWQPLAVKLRDAGVQSFEFVGEGENLANLQRAMAEIGYTPKVQLMETNFYDQEYLNAAGDAANGTFVKTSIWPFEEADQNPATQRYLDIVNATNGKIAILGVQSMSAWLLFATAAKTCDLDNNLTRTCVLDHVAAVSSWDAGGLHAPTNPSANESSECVIVLQVVDGAFTRYTPDSDYHCDPKDVVTVSVSG